MHRSPTASKQATTPAVPAKQRRAGMTGIFEIKG
jgi:hypothetical protein